MTSARWCGPVAALLIWAAGCTMGVDLGHSAEPAGGVLPFAGPRSTCLLNPSGRLQCLGAGGDGQLGRAPDTLASSCAGEPCDAFPTTFALSDTTSVALGDAFTCVVLDQRVWCVGSNAYGTLGRGTRDADVHAEPLQADVLGDVVEVVAGRHHVCARRTDGTVACWGLGVHGALGAPPAALSDCGVSDATNAERLGVEVDETLRCTAEPRDVPGIDDALGLRAGPFGTCVLRAGGPLCFGRNVDGGLGVEGAAGERIATPTRALVLDAIDVALGARHGCAVDARGRTLCFGAHDLGQLGVGGAAPDVCDTLPCALTPQRVTDLASAQRVVAGDHHTCVLLEDDTLRCFGSDALGQLGNSMGAVDMCGATPCARTPRAVVQLEGEGVVRAAASGDHTVFVTADALVLAFGSNTHRECAANTPDPLPFPQRIYGVGP